MFDENVHFIQKFGYIEDTENLGSHGRRSNIANHALVLCSMVSVKKGEATRFYYLIQGSTKCEMLVNFLMEVIDACQNAGLEVVATVCDMGANKLLGVSDKTSFFRFQDREIAAMFDPPLSP